VNPSESDGQGPAHGSSSIFTGALALCALLKIAPAIAAPDEAAERDHLAVLELGATGEREISEHISHIGPTVGVEIEPIENWP
jgi:hypothetical protein